MTSTNPSLVPSPQESKTRRRLFVAGLALGLAFLCQTARSQPAPDGQDGPAPTSGSFGAAVLALDPVAFWQLNETNQVTTTAPFLQAYDYTGNGFNGTYGGDALNGYFLIYGPQPSATPPSYPGFALNQGALQCTSNDPISSVSLPPLNLETNTVTIAMWINPQENPINYAGLLMNRTAGGDAAGFGFGGNDNSSGMPALGYTWNDNNGNTYNFNSQLYPQIGVWSFVVLVIQPTSATIYMYYLDSDGNPQLNYAVNTVAHTVENFQVGGFYLGSDVNQNTVTAANNEFSGIISDAAVFNKALTANQVMSLFAAGLGQSGFKPSITVQPASIYVASGANTQLSATGIGGNTPFAYQWMLNSTKLTGNATFSGVNSNILTITGATAANAAGTYQLVITNAYGITDSSNAVLTIQSAKLIGEWLTNQSFADLSGYSPPGRHDGYLVGNGNYVFTNDLPPGVSSGYSIYFPSNDTGIAISNTSTLNITSPGSSLTDTNYDSTFDNVIDNAFTVQCWSRGFPGSWNPWVSKFGEDSPETGWQLRPYGGGPYACFTVRDNGGGSQFCIPGTSTNGEAPWDDMSTTTYASQDASWHLYTGVFDAGTGIRYLYVDAKLVAGETNGNIPYPLATAEHLCINAKDSPPGNSITNFSSIEIFDVRIYNYPLSQSDIAKYYGQLPAVVNGQPQPLAAFTNTTKQLSVAAGGTLPIEYQWQLNGVSLANNANYSGVNSNILTITGVTPGDAGEYSVIVWNQYGTNVSSNALVSIVYPSVVGEWFNGDTNLNDISGYTPTNTHDGFAVTSAGPGGTYAFTTNVPPYRLGQSLSLGGTTAIAITNSATTDGAYTNTYDAGISGAFSVAFWANGVGPGGANWVQWVSKDGYNNDGTYDSGGWSIGIEAWSQYLNFSMNGIDAGGISYPGNIGDGLWGNGILESPPYPVHTGWHHYAGTYNAATGIRCTYYDGALVAYQAGDAPYNLAPAEHLIIGGQQQSIGYDGFETSSIYDVRIYNYAISSNDVQQLLAIPAGTPAQITQQPAAAITTVCEGVNVQIAAVSGGSPTITNQWQFNGTPLVDGPYLGAIISGSATSVLTIADVTTNNQGVYTFATSNAFGGTASAGTTLTVGVLPIATVPTTNLVGAWLTGAATLADTSGYSPMGAHDASVQSGTTYWTSDVPPIAPAGASSLYFKNAGLIVSNSSTLAKGYVNTFDDIINTNGMTVTCWAKGYPGGWNPWVSKYGENGHGWQLRVNAANPEQPTWTIRGTGGNEDMNESGSTSDGFWHFYAGTYSPVTSNRLLYVDGLMVVSQTGQGPLSGSPTSFLMIGAKDSGGDAFGNYFTGEIYGVQIFDAELTTNQIGDLMTQEPPLAPSVPVFNLTNNVQVIPGAGGSKVGGEFVISWSTGSLWESTNLATSWIHLTNATSPYTNIIGGANEYFKLSNP
jgi:hypothetical protein